MLMIILMSVITVVLCVLFFCTLNGNVCEKAWADIKQKAKKADEDWSKMYDHGH